MPKGVFAIGNALTGLGHGQASFQILLKNPPFILREPQDERKLG